MLLINRQSEAEKKIAELYGDLNRRAGASPFGSCPVIGDKVYGKSALDKKLDSVPARQMLHAWKLKLWHPVKKVEMEFEAPLPGDMKIYL